MKVCQINCVYGSGSTGKIVRDIHLTLKDQGIESLVIAPLKSKDASDGEIYSTTTKYLSYFSAIIRRYLGFQYGFSQIQTWRMIKILKREMPDIVHLQCINGNDINIYMLEKYLAKNKIKTLYTIHAEFPYTGGCGHAFDCEKWLIECGGCPRKKEATQSPIIDPSHRTWLKQNDAYQRFDKQLLRFTTVSPWLLMRAEQSPMLTHFKKTVVINGIDTSIFRYQVPQPIWRRRLNLSLDDIIIAHVTACFIPHSYNIKGGEYIVKLAERLKEISPKYKIIVAAGQGESSDLPDNIIYIGRTEDQEELAQLYREAKVTVIASKKETFCMPVSETLCCGTPIVGFLAGGPESIAIKEYSDFVEHANVDALTEKVVKWANTDYDAREIATKAYDIYSKETMTNNYIEQYNELMKI